MHITSFLQRLVTAASCFAFAGSFSWIASSVQAQTELRVATIAPEGTPWIKNLNKWAENLEKLSDGDLTLRIFPGGQLGNELDTFKQTQRGRIDIVGLGGGALSEQVTEISLMSTPFLFDDVAVIDCIYDGHFGAALADEIQDHNVELLFWSEVGWGSVFAKDDLSDVTQADGYKVRIAHNEMSRLLWNSVGASGIELPYVEMPGALQTGLVDAGEATGLTFVAFGLNKVAPHFVETKHTHQAGAVLIGERTLERLSSEQRQMLVDSIPAVSELRSTIRGVSEKMIDRHREAGGPVHTLTDAERKAWKAKVEPQWPDFVAGLGGNAEKLWPQLLEAKVACEGG